MAVTGLSGNEIFCLMQKGYRPGNIVVGNSVHALGIVGSLGSGIRAIVGGEIQQLTSLIEEGRATAYKRMSDEALSHQASGITGVSSELIFHGSNIEFLSIGSVVHATHAENTSPFSTSADGQSLFAQLDANYQPICFAFGNVVYAMGIGRGILGGLKTLARGEIKEYSDIFNHTRHLALERIIAHAKQHKANAVLGIETNILSFGGVNEMLMIGTASRHSFSAISEEVITSDMTNVEMWNMAKLGYMPMRLLLGTSIYSLGLIGGFTSLIKTLVRGEINELTRLIYDARENALSIINAEAKTIGADEVVGVKTYVYQLGNGLIEFLAIGTAVKKVPNVKTESDQLPPQAIVVDEATFFNANRSNRSINLNASTNANRSGIGVVIFFVIVIIYIILTFSGRH